MTDILLVLSVAIGIYLSITVGINTLGSTVGLIRGSTKINYWGAVAGATAAALLGIALLSNRIVDTFSKDLIRLEIGGVFAVLLAVIIIATVLALRGIPISTTYIIVGAITGYGFIASSSLSIAVLEKIIFSIFLSPFIALLFGFLLFYTIKNLVMKRLKGIRRMESFEIKFFAPVFIAMLILSFALGANSVGVVIGLLGNVFNFTTLFIIGSMGLLIGVLTFGKRTSHRIGIEIVDLSPSRGFIIMLVTGIVMASFVYFGIPISTTQTLLGAMIGVGLATRHVDFKHAAKVSASWLVLLPGAIVILSILFAGGIGFIL